jgi:predicted DNA-binding transcriptional regulator AlpA
MPTATASRKSQTKSQRRRPISEIESLELWGLPVVRQKTGQTKAAIYRLMALGLFPKPLVMPSGVGAITPRGRCWVSEEVVRWIAQQIENNERGGTGRAAVTNVPWARTRMSTNTDNSP